MRVGSGTEKDHKQFHAPMSRQGRQAQRWKGGRSENDSHSPLQIAQRHYVFHDWRYQFTFRDVEALNSNTRL